MRRRLLNLLACLSLLLFVEACALWIRSDDYEESLEWAVPTSAASANGLTWTRYRGGSIRSEAGRLTLALGERWTPAARPLPGCWATSWHTGTVLCGNFEGELKPASSVALPLWAVSTALGVLPVVAVTRIVHDRKGHRAGLCPACGYDLRATPDRCPECGARR